MGGEALSFFLPPPTVAVILDQTKEGFSDCIHEIDARTSETIN